jgi:hypothetical protein
MESFLKEQLKRIQDLAAQMSSLAKRTAELSAERKRAHEALSPLADVKDLRTYSSLSRKGSRQPRATADDRHHSRSRRRRRRRS